MIIIHNIEIMLSVTLRYPAELKGDNSDSTQYIPYFG